VSQSSCSWLLLVVGDWQVSAAWSIRCRACIVGGLPQWWYQLPPVTVVMRLVLAAWPGALDRCMVSARGRPPRHAVHAVGRQAMISFDGVTAAVSNNELMDMVQLHTGACRSLVDFLTVTQTKPIIIATHHHRMCLSVCVVWRVRPQRPVSFPCLTTCHFTRETLC